MFNVAVLKMKDLIKGIIGITVTILIIIIISKSNLKIEHKKQENEEKNKESNIKKLEIGSLTSCLETSIPAIKELQEINKDDSNHNDNVKSEIEEDEKENNGYLEKILKTEISGIKALEDIEKEKIEEAKSNTNNQIINNENSENSENITNENKEITLAATQNMKTEIVTQNPISEKYNVEYGKVKIKNQTSYELTQDILKPDITIENKNVLIFHTHTCESYTSSEKYPYASTGNYRTIDLNYSVSRVGTELTNYLQKYNINVIHDTTYHDYPSYNGSYTRSLSTVENILKENPADIIIDLHRDAIGSREDYAPTVKIGEDYCAQIMFVIRNK